MVNVSFFLVESPPGRGAGLHKHPYEEVFVLQEGEATFTIGEDVIAARGGQIVVVPADVPHKFVNSGSGPLTARFIVSDPEDGIQHARRSPGHPQR
jgi:mannose-6-phosphate isomerase-like protein (cupin superfamily)